MQFLRAISILLFIIFLSCNTGDNTNSKSYFPLTEGKTSEFQTNINISINDDYSIMLSRINNNIGNIKTTIRIVSTNMGKRELNNKPTTPVKIDVNSNIRFLFYCEDNSGIYELAEQSPKDIEPRLIQPLNYIIRYPISKGTEWDGKIKSIIDRNIKINLKVNIDSINDTVTTPYGTLNNCLKVKKFGKINYKPSKKSNVNLDTSFEQYFWYAQGIGIVKSITKETSKFFDRDKEIILYTAEISEQLISVK